MDRQTRVSKGQAAQSECRAGGPEWVHMLDVGSPERDGTVLYKLMGVGPYSTKI